MTTGPDNESASAIGAAFAARGRLAQWTAGAEIVALLGACERAGWSTHLVEGVDLESLSSAVGGSRDRVANVLEVLTASGIVDCDGARYVLREDFAALTRGASGVTLGVALDAAELQRARLRALVDADESSLGGAEALVLARAWGLAPTAGARELYQAVYASLPPLNDRLAAGGAFLDVGCGIGGNLFATVGAFPDTRAVGLELVPEVAAETRRRAGEAGLEERVEVRTLDARELDEREVYTAAYWAQEFFVAEARPRVLAVIHRALVPGGLLVLQELFPTDGDLDPRQALDQLFFNSLGARYGRSAEDLAQEAVAAGFVHEMTAESPAGRLVLLSRS